MSKLIRCLRVAWRAFVEEWQDAECDVGEMIAASEAARRQAVNDRFMQYEAACNEMRAGDKAKQLGVQA